MSFTVIPTVTDGDDATDDFPQAVKAFADEVSTLGASSELGSDSLAAVGAGPTTIDSMTVPAPGVPGHLVAWGTATWIKSVAADRFTLRLNVNASVRCAMVEPNPTAGQPTVGGGSLIGAIGITGLADVDILLELVRTTGAGTATPQGGAFGSLGYIFIPNP